jgi:hypothetical protein
MTSSVTLRVKRNLFGVSAGLRDAGGHALPDDAGIAGLAHRRHGCRRNSSGGGRFMQEFVEF